MVELERGQVDCSVVLLALPAHKIAGLQISTLPALDVLPLATVQYPPVASVVLSFRREDVAHPLDGFGMLIPEKEGFSILGALFSSSLFPNRAPAGEVTITCYIGGARQPLLALCTPEELVEIAVKDLGTILGLRGRADVSTRCGLSQSNSAIQCRIRKIPRADERNGSAGAGLVFGRARPRRRLAGRLHCLGAKGRGPRSEHFSTPYIAACNRPDVKQISVTELKGKSIAGKNGSSSRR